MQDKALAMLGMATKRGKVVSGEFSVEKAVKEGKAWLVLVAEDASDNTKRVLRTCVNFMSATLFLWQKENLGHAIGKEFRASVAITDENLAQAVKKKITLV